MRLSSSPVAAVVFVVAALAVAAASAGKPSDSATAAQFARWLAHNTTFGVVSTISHMNGYPFGNLFSFVDGTVDNSTGHLYFYASPLDTSMIDFRTVSPKCSFTLTQEVTGTCTLDPEDPTCARLVFSGTMRNCTEDEIPFAREAMFQRHPEMKNWSPSGMHDFTFLTLDLADAWMVNHYGGGINIDIDEYYAATPKKAQEAAEPTLTRFNPHH